MTADGPAVWARQVLAAASTEVTLLIDGMPRARPGRDAVLMLDWGGRPRFVCEPGSAVQRAAACGRPALLTVRHEQWRIAVTGRLAVLPAASGLPVETVVMEPTAVFLEPANDDAWQSGRQAIPLEAYFDSAAFYRTDDPVAV
jgi:hypothetical protein